MGVWAGVGAGDAHAGVWGEANPIPYTPRPQPSKPHTRNPRPLLLLLYSRYRSFKVLEP